MELKSLPCLLLLLPCLLSLSPILPSVSVSAFYPLSLLPTTQLYNSDSSSSSGSGSCSDFTLLFVSWLGWRGRHLKGRKERTNVGCEGENKQKGKGEVKTKTRTMTAEGDKL